MAPAVQSGGLVFCDAINLSKLSEVGVYVVFL